MKGKTVFITGASSGIGEACAFAFAEKGARLALMARNRVRLEEISRQLESIGSEVLVLEGDVRKVEDCRQAVNATVNRFGGIDILINNAGISMRAMFVESDLKVIEEVMDTNFWGTVYCTKFALPYLLKSKGSVIGVNSWAGFTGLPARTAYSASKFALYGFLEALRVENMKTGLHVGNIFPGYTRSNIRNTALNAKGEAQKESPLDENKLMPPEVVARHIVEMTEKRINNRVVSLTGKLFYWIRKHFPSLSDRIIYRVVSKEKDSPFK